MAGFPPSVLPHRIHEQTPVSRSYVRQLAEAARSGNRPPRVGSARWSPIASRSTIWGAHRGIEASSFAETQNAHEVNLVTSFRASAELHRSGPDGQLSASIWAMSNHRWNGP